MSDGGGKGGSQESDIAKSMQPYRDRFMDDAQIASRMEYLPYVGPDVAAINPYEQSAMLNTNSMADAFNMGGGLPADPSSLMPETVASHEGGVQGYSAAPMFFEALLQSQQANPNYFRQRSQFMTPPTNAQAGIYGGPIPRQQGPGSPPVQDPGGPYIQGYENTRPQSEEQAMMAQLLQGLMA